MTNDRPFTIVDVETACDVGFLRIDKLVVRTPTGGTVERVTVVHPGAVAVVAMDGDDVILIAQYRAPVDAVVVEIPAGKLDKPGEDRITAAHRELTEETGYIADDLVHLTDLQTGVGFTNEVISIYMASSVRPGPPLPQGAEEHEAAIVKRPFGDVVADVRNGTITDSKTIAGILLAEHRRGTP